MNKAGKGMRQRSSDKFKAEVNRWAEKIKAQPLEIRIQRMTRKWASCSPKGRLCFSLELLGKPRRFREFVIVHELIHLRVPNHGKLFKSLVKAYLPNSQKIDQLDSSFDAEEDTVILRRVKRKTNWLEVWKKCPVPMDDLPARSRELDR